MDHHAVELEEAEYSNSHSIHRNRQEISDEGLILYGYRKDSVRNLGYYALAILTLGLSLLIFKWFPMHRLKFTHIPCTINVADTIVVKHLIDGSDICPVMQINSGDEDSYGTSSFTFFTYRCIRYSWNEAKSCFEKARFDVNRCYTDIYRDYVNLERGLNSSVVRGERERFGENLIRVPVTSYFNLAVNEVLHPFYIFQIISILIWAVDEYVVYASCIAVMSATSALYNVIQTRKNMESLCEMAKLIVPVDVMRDGTVSQQIPSTQLVPGDLLKIEAGMTLPCDAILVQGSAVLNESMLTGESLPILKTHLPKHEEGMKPYDSEEDARFTLFAGTQVTQSRNEAWALVYGTGFATSKGLLVRSILYPKPTKFKFYRDSFRFIGFLFFLAILGFIYAVVQFVRFGAAFGDIIVRGLDLLTIVIPPGLPVAMTIGTGYAMSRLKKQNIFCISPIRVNVSGRVNVMCFDKTGTLTEEGLDVLGVQAVKEGSNDSFNELDSNLRNTRFPLNLALASCHSLTIIEDGNQKQFVGDTLEVKMFEAMHYSLEDLPERGSPYPGVLTLLKDGEVTLGILKRFDFSSKLQRMSVIVRNLGDNRLFGFVKGSPEMIRDLSEPSTIPEDFDSILSSHTNQGYRVIGLSYVEFPSDIPIEMIKQMPRTSLETNLTFLGFFILQNKLKDDTQTYIQKLNNANIRNIMVTGDNALTAVNVSRKCSLLPLSTAAYLCDVSTNDDGSAISLPTNRQLKCTFIPPPVEEEVQIHPQQSVVVGIDTFDLPNWFFEEEVGLAVTGRAYNVLCNGDPTLLDRVLSKASVYARMSPFQKADLVEKLQAQGHTVGMCGDGANDCGALKAADVGLSLSEAEASVAAPFTSKISSIRSVHILLREGRCALATSVQIFKFMALYSLIQFLSILVCYSLGSMFGDYQFLWVDLFIIIPLVALMGRTGPSDELSKQKPIASLISVPVLSSVMGQIIIMAVFEIALFLYLSHQSWYQPPKKHEDGYHPKSSDNVINMGVTSTFLFANFQYLCVFLAYSISKPFRKPLRTNGYLIAFLIIIYILNVYIVLGPAKWLSNILQLDQSLPQGYLFIILVTMMINSVICWFYERVVVVGIFDKYVK